MRKIYSLVVLILLLLGEVLVGQIHRTAVIQKPVNIPISVHTPVGTSQPPALAIPVTGKIFLTMVVCCGDGGGGGGGVGCNAVAGTIGTTPPGTQTVCSGSNSTTLTLSGYSGSSIQWYSAPAGSSGFTAIDGATGPTYIVTNLSQTTAFDADVSGNACNAFSPSIIITVATPATWYKDQDGDGYGDPAQSTVACAQPAGYVSNNSDCDDNDPTIHPGAPEICDGKDNNCDGQIDEGLTQTRFYLDYDGDGFGDPNNSILSCSQPAGYVTNNTDCDDSDPTVHPGAPEICDGKDNNCNGAIDEGLGSTWYLDNDLDGYGDPTHSTVACAQPAGYVSNNSDCDDNDPTVHPGAPEICDGKDNNCDGNIDEGFTKTTFYRDADGDGYGDPNNSTLSCSQPAGYVTNNTDCSDNDPLVHAPILFYVDADHDGYGSTTTALICASTPPPGYSTNNTDCNDNDRTVHTAQTYYRDADGDGYGNPALSTTTCSSTPPTGYVANSTDCNDADLRIHAPVLYYVDADHDGYGSQTSVLLCSSRPPYGYSTNNSDCNDKNPLIHPGAIDFCGNGIDENCNGQVDEGCVACQNATTETTTNITTSSAKLNWTATNSPLAWEVDYKKSSASNWIILVLSGNARFASVSSLSSNQTYNWRIRALCGKTWTSYSSVVSFKTLSRGRSSISYARPLQEDASRGLQVYPNPNNGQFEIRLNTDGGSDGLANIQLFDLTGRMIHQQSETISAGLLHRTINLQSLVAGEVYMLRIITKDRMYQAKLVCEK